MKQREIVEFTSQLATTIIAHRRIISQFLRKDHALEYNEFAVLLYLREAENPQQAQSIRDALSLSKRILWAILLDLENRGLIKKDVNENDARTMSISLSEAGMHCADRTLAGLDDLAHRNFWAQTPAAEIVAVSQSGASKCLANLEGHSSFESSDDTSKTYFTCALLTFIRLLPRRWEAVTQEKGNLSLGEYRLLSSLEKLGPMSPQDASQQLLVQKSSVSSYKEKLLNEKLITEKSNPEDKRSVLLMISSKGNDIAGYLTDELNDMTRLVYAAMTDNEARACNILTSRMYHNLRLAY